MDAQTRIKNDRVAFYTPVDCIKLWFCIPEMLDELKSSNENFTHPFILNIEDSLADRLHQMEDDDYLFEGFHSGSEWLAVLSRTKESWHSRLLPDHSKSKWDIFVHDLRYPLTKST